MQSCATESVAARGYGSLSTVTLEHVINYTSISLGSAHNPTHLPIACRLVHHEHVTYICFCLAAEVCRGAGNPPDLWCRFEHEH